MLLWGSHTSSVCVGATMLDIMLGMVALTLLHCNFLIFTFMKRKEEERQLLMERIPVTDMSGPWEDMSDG
tara:strand:- start:3171 stop:3380 length:210 start_codon:yes stop_codon:yes gene_type:complete